MVTNPLLPIGDAQFEVHSTAFAYARAGASAKFNGVLLYALVSGSVKAIGQLRDREVSGFADPEFQFSVNLFGVPAFF